MINTLYLSFHPFSITTYVKLTVSSNKEHSFLYSMVDAKPDSGYFLPFLFSDAGCTFIKEMAILKFPSIIMSVVLSIRLPLIKHYNAVVSLRVLGPLLHILFYSFLLSSACLSLLYTIPFYSLHPYSER
jgi:hypothetical protein